ncbi:MAG: amidohydrolase [Acidobacteria bacterium]|nr:MAG: amidohydrolase [Acidobacteriota bacterium]
MNADELAGRLVALRRALHRRPELSGKEERTAAVVASELRRIGLPVSAPVGGHGVVAEVPGAGRGGAILLRADLDALPIAEETGLPFASEHPGVMHACGHDGHAAMLVGAAELLAAGDPPPRTVRLLWQPAEERGGGARALIEAGVLEGAAAIFGGHIDPRFDTGVIAVTDGAVNASSDRFTIRVSGRGGHGARPQEARDALLAAAHLVVAIQSIVAREIAPGRPAVVTVGRMEAGTAANVVAGDAVLSGTVRALDREVREAIKTALGRVTERIAAAHRCRGALEFAGGTPPVVNDPRLAALAREAVRRICGEAGLAAMSEPNLGAEDFGCYLEKIPGCYVRFGARRAGAEVHPPHTSRFDFDEAVLPIGAAYYAEVARLAGERLDEEGIR